MGKGAPRTSGKGDLRAAIIGCGFIAGLRDVPKADRAVRSHAKAYWLERATRLVAVADRDLTRAQEFARRWKVPSAYGNSRAMLVKESPDIVSICTPDDIHLEILEECLEFSSIKAVWCEKPLGTDVRRAARVVAAYRRRGVVLAVNYQRRWDPLMLQVKEAIMGGKLGDMQKVVVYYSKGLLHNGSHAVDLLLDWFGPPTRAQVLAKTYDFTQRDPTVDAFLVMKGSPVHLVGIDARHYSVFEMELFGTNGRVTLASFGQRVEWYSRENASGPDQAGELAEHPRIERRGVPTAMGLAVEEIIQVIRKGGHVRSSGETALATLRVCRELADLSCNAAMMTMRRR